LDLQEEEEGQDSVVEIQDSAAVVLSEVDSVVVVDSAAEVVLLDSAAVVLSVVDSVVVVVMDSAVVVDLAAEEVLQDSAAMVEEEASYLATHTVPVAMDGNQRHN